MKKSLFYLLVIILISSVALSGCKLAGTSFTTNVEKIHTKPSIVILLPSDAKGWNQAVKYYTEKIAVEMLINHKILFSDSAAQQSSQIDTLVSEGCGAIILLPHGEELEDAAQKAIDAGIPLINLEEKLNVNALSYVRGDNEGVGLNGAEYIANKLKGKGSIVIVQASSHEPVNSIRVNAFKKTISENYPDIKIVGEYDCPSISRTHGLKQMSEILKSNQKIDGVFSIDDELSIGVYEAIKDAKRKDIKVLASGGGMQEFYQLIESSDIALASAAYPPSMIIDCIKAAAELIRSKVWPDEQIIQPAVLVDKENVFYYLDQDSPY